jgi:UDP-N-acetylglucosamine--N-acetylmuramyl-(pentapeptide) pyrophosphoryl-undecaprenol N-acetylglucosamine transferase
MLAPDSPPAPAAAAASEAVTLLWVGSVGGMEQGLVERAGIPFKGIETGQLRGINPLTALANAGKMLKGLRQSLRILSDFKPDVCFVTGGYVCAPVVVACRMRRVPVLIYLPDMVPGAAILWLSRLAQRVAISFPEAARYFGGLAPQGKAVVTGYPVRRELVEAARSRVESRRKLAQIIDRPSMDGSDDLPLVLIWGGSLGARSINMATWAALVDLLPHAHVLHVVGQRDWTIAKEQTQNLRSIGVLSGGALRRYHPVDYLHESMSLALASADLTVARAGASTLGEFPVAGLPSVLIPLVLPGVNQQVNAEQLVRHGAAVVVDDTKLADDLARTVIELLNQNERRTAMSQAAAQLARPNAAQQIADELAALATGYRGLK